MKALPHKLAWRALALLSVLACPALASAQFSSQHSDDAQHRTADMDFTMVRTSTGTDVAVGYRGVLWAPTVAGAAAPTTTSTMAQPAYPTRLAVRLVDGGAASPALTCTNLTIKGYTRVGGKGPYARDPITEVMTSISETRQYSKNVFEKVTYFKATGCTNTLPTYDSSDRLRISMSEQVATPVLIEDYRDIISACILGYSNYVVANSQANFPFCVTEEDMDELLVTKYVAGAEAPLSAINLLADLASNNPWGGNLPAHGDRVRIRIRGKQPKPY